jgi:D-amino-acid dehydrogenase
MAKTIDVLIIGGGVIGLAIAKAAAEKGADVMVLEADRIGRGSSYGNAGLIVPSYCLPLANPQAIKGLPDLLWGEERSLRLKLRLDLNFLRWTLHFLAASRQEKMMTSAALRRQLAQRSLALFSEWEAEGASFGFRRRGWLHLYQSEKGLSAGRREAELLRRLGTKVEELSPMETIGLEPTVPDSVVGALFFPAEAQVEPYPFCRWLAERAIAAGAQIVERQPAGQLSLEQGRIIGWQADQQLLQAGAYVVAAGAWSGRLIKPLGGSLLLEPAKGYSLTFQSANNRPARPLMLVDRHVVITPFADTLRLTTGLDLAGFDERLDSGALAKLHRAAATWVGSEPDRIASEAWFGYRPLTPDGLPVLGPAAAQPNLFLACGHGQLGITLAPASGEMMAALLAGEAPPVEAAPFSPARLGL